jgi:ElaB/YqjD/DUF883 family membrane-anchored ribosome-binding protein
MADEQQETALVRRRPTALDQRRSALRERLEDSQRRLELAIAEARSRARSLSPAARIQDDPWRWVLAAAAVGFLLARFTRPRRRR